MKKKKQNQNDMPTPNIIYLHYMGLIQPIHTKYKSSWKKEGMQRKYWKIMQQKERVVKSIYETKLKRNQQIPEKAHKKLKHYLKLKFQEIIL